MPQGINAPRGSRDRVYWRDSVAPYERASLRLSLFDLATSVLPYLVLTVAMYLCLDVSVWLTLALAVPAAGFLLRTFIVFHDCAHGSFLPTKRGNLWLGRLTGLLVFQPFANWRHNHAVHHGTAGDLDRRGTGDVPTLTVEEYASRSWRRGSATGSSAVPLVMFGIGPIWSLMIGPRIWSKQMRPRQRHSVWLTNLALRARDRRDRLARRPARLAAGADAGRDPRRHRGRLPLLRPAPVRGRLLGELENAGATPTRRCRAAPT